MDDLIKRSDAVRVVEDWYQYGSGRAMLIDSINALPAAGPPPPAESAAEGVTVTAELRKKIERLAKALIDMNITLCKYVADDGNLTPMQSEAIRKAYIAEQVNASMVFHDLAAAGKAGAK